MRKNNQDDVEKRSQCDKRIYIAGPIFSKHQRHFLANLVNELCRESKLDKDKDFFLPHRDAGLATVKNRKKNFDYDVKALLNARIVIAWLDGQDVDSGTAVELGIAQGINEGINENQSKKKTIPKKKIFGLLTDETPNWLH